jgi:hypothetical protein
MATARRSFPDLRGTVEQVLAEGDLAAGRVTWRDTQAGPFVGGAPTGRFVAFEAYHIARFEGGGSRSGGAPPTSSGRSRSSARWRGLAKSYGVVLVGFGHGYVPTQRGFFRELRTNGVLIPSRFDDGIMGAWQRYSTHR